MENSCVISHTKKNRVTYFTAGSSGYVRKEVLGKFCEVMCDHEVLVLNRLKGLDSIQQIVEQDSPTSFISEYVPGTALLYSKQLPSDYFDKLKVLIAEVHERGVADMDFGHSTDIIVSPEGNPKLIDLAASIIYNPNSATGILVKPLFDYVCSLNYKYLVNRKGRFQPEQLTAEEAIFFHKRRILSSTFRKVKKILRNKN